MKPRYIAVIVFLTLLIAYTYVLRDDSQDPLPPAALDRIPLSLGGYHGQEETLDDRLLDALAADEALFRTYRTAGGRQVWLFMGYFSAPRENSQIHSPKHCYPGAGWDIHKESTVTLRLGEGPVAAKKLMIAREAQNQVVYYWFETESGIVTNEYALKWEMMKNALLGRSQRTTFVRFSTTVEPRSDGESADDVLKAFAETLAPHIRAAIGGEA